MTKKVLVGIRLKPERLQELSGDILVESLASNEDRYSEMLDRIQEYHGVLLMGTKGDRPLLKKGKKLEVVANYGVGVDNVDLDCARELGIAVTNTPNSTTAGTATMAMALILDLFRKITWSDRKLRNNSHPKWGSRAALGNAPEGKTLGIIGMGRIGRALAKRALSFEMNILYYNRNRLAPNLEKECRATYCPLPELLQKADVLSINCPLNADTRGMIGREELAMMKPSAYLVNTGRGPIVDQQSLIEALSQGSIAGAGLDVFWDEPDIPDALKQLDNVVLTPHNGTGTIEDRDAMFNEAFGNMIAYLKGTPMTSRVA